MSAALQLRVFREGRELETVALNGELVVGRAEGCALRLQDQKISRKHLVLIPSQGGVRAESRSEFSPVRVNGREVSSAQLVPGDSIELGPFLIKLEDSGGASTPNREMIHSQGVPHLSSGVSASVAPVDRRGSGVSLASPPENSLSLDPTGSQEASEAALPETGEESPLELGQQEENSLAVSSEVDGSSESDQSGPVGTGLDGGLDGGASLGGGHSEHAGGSDFSDDGKTRVTTALRLAAKLVIPSGAANVTEAELVRDVITVGRRRECEVVLSDKRASKKHFEIRRVGTQFLLKDLGSTTGTFVNDEQVTEAEIGHGDQIRVGSVEMVFEAISAEYSERQADFLSVESEVGGDLPAPLDFQGGGSEPAMEGAVPLQGAAAQFDLNHPQGEFQQQAHLGLSGDPSSGGQEIPGIESPKKKADRGLLARFRALTPRQQIIALPIILLGFWLLLEDDAPVEKKNPKKKPKVMASAKPSPGPKTYENLSDADKQLVNQRMSMAQTAFQNRAFDESIDAARMVTVILPDYTPATTMIALATAANEKKKQAEAEAARIKMEREQQLRIEALLAETAELMKQKKYAAAEEKFGEILSTDPENIKVSEWKRIIKEEQDLAAEKKREKEQEAQIRALMHERYLEAKALFDEKKYYEAIEASGRVEGKANSTDKKAAVALAVSARKAIDDLRDPLLKQARDSENNGELSKAFDLYQKATEADYLHKEGYDAMKRIRMVLHERGRKLYREGVLAEYFNDVPEALAKFNEILTVVPKDDDYHLRAVRKLARYGQEPSRKPSAEGAPTSEGAGAGSQGTGGP